MWMMRDFLRWPFFNNNNNNNKYCFGLGRLPAQFSVSNQLSYQLITHWLHRCHWLVMSGHRAGKLSTVYVLHHSILHPHKSHCKLNLKRERWMNYVQQKPTKKKATYLLINWNNKWEVFCGQVLSFWAFSADGHWNKTKKAKSTDDV